MLSITWIVPAIIFALPVFGLWGNSDIRENVTWQCEWRDGDSLRKFAFFYLYAIPLTILFVCYTCIFVTIRKMQRSFGDILDTNTGKTSKQGTFISYVCQIIHKYLGLTPGSTYFLLKLGGDGAWLVQCIFGNVKAYQGSFHE